MKLPGNRVFLTMLGGGAFGNESHWIIESMASALQLFKRSPLDVRIVSYGASHPEVRDLVKAVWQKLPKSKLRSQA